MENRILKLYSRRKVTTGTAHLYNSEALFQNFDLFIRLVG
jgi:hypothetical protein